MKILRTMLSVMLVAAVLMTMVLSANAYTYTPSKGAASENKTAALAGDTYVYDFTDGHIALADLVSHNGNASSTTYNNRLQFNIATQASSANKAGYYTEMYLADNFCIGNPAADANRKNTEYKLKAEAGHIYEITVDYSLWTSAAGKSLCLVTGYSWNHAFDGLTVKMPVETTGTTNHPTNSASRTTVTFTVDADKEYDIQKQDGTATTQKFNYIGISSVGGTGTFNIYTVTVKVFDKAVIAAEAEKVEKLYNYSNDDVALNFNGGLNDLYMPNTRNSGNEKLDYEVVKDGSNKYLKVTNKMTSATTVNFGFAAAAGRGEFKDYGVAANKADVDGGFKTVAGVKYAVSYDIYVEERDGNFANGTLFYLCDKAGVGASGGNKAQQSLQNVKNGTNVINDGGADGQWITVSFTFTASKSGYGVISWQNLAGDADGDGIASIFYIDNIVVRVVEGDEVTTNTKRSIRAASGEGDAYVSAGLRLRGDIWGGTANNATEVGFIVAPEVLADAYTGEGKWFELNGTGANLETAARVNVTEKIYEAVSGGNNSYQVLIKDLTKEGETKNLLGVNFNVMMYLKKTDGSVVYYTVGTASYNEVNATYILAE